MHFTQLCQFIFFKTSFIHFLGGGHFPMHLLDLIPVLTNSFAFSKNKQQPDLSSLAHAHLTFALTLLFRTNSMCMLAFSNHFFCCIHAAILPLLFSFFVSTALYNPENKNSYSKHHLVLLKLFFILVMYFRGCFG